MRIRGCDRELQWVDGSSVVVAECVVESCQSWRATFIQDNNKANIYSIALQGHRPRCRWWNWSTSLPSLEAQPTVSSSLESVKTIADRRNSVTDLALYDIRGGPGTYHLQCIPRNIQLTAL